MATSETVSRYNVDYAQEVDQGNVYMATNGEGVIVAEKVLRSDSEGAVENASKTSKLSSSGSRGAPPGLQI